MQKGIDSGSSNQLNYIVTVFTQTVQEYIIKDYQKLLFQISRAIYTV